MKNNFDLKKFLVENKLTENSKVLKENTRGFDALMIAVDDYIDPSHPDHERLAQAVENALDNGDIDTLEFSHSLGAPDRAVEFIAKELGIEPQTSEAALEAEEEYEERPGMFIDDEEWEREMGRGPKEELFSEGDINSIKANLAYQSAEVEGVDTSDYPDFSDAFISYAEYKDGTPLSDEELDILNNDEAGMELAQELALASLHEEKEGFDIREFMKKNKLTRNSTMNEVDEDSLVTKMLRNPSNKAYMSLMRSRGQHTDEKKRYLTAMIDFIQSLPGSKLTKGHILDVVEDYYTDIATISKTRQIEPSTDQDTKDLAQAAE